MSAFREAVIDLGAIRKNMVHLRSVAGTPHAMAVVKANGYGHGAVAVARAALSGGADWLGVADIDEALALRDAGIDAPILAWLHDPDADFSAAIDDDITLGLSSVQQVQQAADAAAELGLTASVHLKLETGLSRNGVHETDWPRVFALAVELEKQGHVHIDGLMSHLANAGAQQDAQALACFERGIAAARAAGLRPSLVHLASSAAALRVPAARFSLVRLGITLYGLSPFAGVTSAELGLTPAMTLRAPVALVRRVSAGSGVSYDYVWRAPHDTTLALVPLGYADGIPRQATGRATDQDTDQATSQATEPAASAASVHIDGHNYPVVGRIAMDQLVVNLGANTSQVAVGDTAVIFGDPARGAPSASDWADAADTINYDIVTRIGHRVRRRYING